MSDNNFKSIGYLPIERIETFCNIIFQFTSDTKDFFINQMKLDTYNDLINQFYSNTENLNKGFKEITENSLISESSKIDIAEDMLNNFDIEIISIINTFKEDLENVIVNFNIGENKYEGIKSVINSFTSFENTILKFTEDSRDMLFYDKSEDFDDDIDDDDIDDDIDDDDIDDDDIDDDDNFDYYKPRYIKNPPGCGGIGMEINIPFDDEDD